MASNEVLQAFVQAATQGSFSAAARKLGKSQSTVSAAVASLEIDLDLVLFDRSSRKPTLTAAGQVLLQRAEQVGLLPAGVGHAAADAYRELRRVQHRARLDEVPTEVTPPALQAEQHAVLDLWHAVFGENSAVSAKA